MQIFRRETSVILHRFLLHQLSFPHCITALADAHTRLSLRFLPGDMAELRVLMLHNNERVMAEMTQRALGSPN